MTLQEMAFQIYVSRLQPNGRNDIKSCYRDAQAFLNYEYVPPKNFTAQEIRQQWEENQQLLKEMQQKLAERKHLADAPPH